MRHAVHGIVGLDLGGAQLRHVGDLVHLRGERLLAEEHLGLLVGLLGLALFEELLDLLLEDGVLLGGFLGLAPRLLGLEARLELDLHVAGELAVRHGCCGGGGVSSESGMKTDFRVCSREDGWFGDGGVRGCLSDWPSCEWHED